MKELNYLIKEIQNPTDSFWFKFLEDINRNKFVLEDMLENIFDFFNYNCDICVIESTRDFENFKSIFKNNIHIDDNLWLLLKRNALIEVAKKNQLQSLSLSKKLKNDEIIKDNYYVHPIITNQNIFYVIFNRFDSASKIQYGLSFEALYLLFQTCEKNDLLAKHTMVDSVTGCYNFNQFQKALGAEIAKVDRIDDSDIVFSVMLIDIDGFNKLNERYGYSCGDNVLKNIAKRIQKKIRTTDDVYRVGGDEFCIINTYATKQISQDAILPRIRDEISKKIHIVDNDYYMPELNIAIVQYKKGMSKNQFEKLMNESIQKAKTTKELVVV